MCEYKLYTARRYPCAPEMCISHYYYYLNRVAAVHVITITCREKHNTYTGCVCPPTGFADAERRFRGVSIEMIEFSPFFIINVYSRGNCIPFTFTFKHQYLVRKS